MDTSLCTVYVKPCQKEDITEEPTPLLDKHCNGLFAHYNTNIIIIIIS